jgi:beta-galactosidase
VLNGQRNGDPLASIAEIEVIGNDGKVLSTQNWKVVYASSEEITSGNHGAEKIYDQQESTFWQSQSVGAKPDYPHQIVLDLGTIEQISRLRYLPRSDKKTEGMVKEYKVYIKKLPFQL